MELCMQAVQSIDVPAYSSKFKILCHKEEQRMVHEAEAWLRARVKESGVEDKDSDVEKLIATKLGEVACRFWPHSPDPKLTLTLIKIMYWFFIFDKVMDEPCMLGTDAIFTQQFCGFVLQAFFSMDASEALVGISHLPMRTSRSLLMPTMTITLLVEWWAELRAGMSTRQQARFYGHFANYVMVHVEQARFTEENEVPGVEEYLRIRMKGGAMNVVEMLAEQDCGIELDDQDLRNPSLKRFNEAIGEHAGLMNDYVGFATEYEKGEYFNLLTVLHYRNNVTMSKKDQHNSHLSPVPFHKACVEAWEIITTIEEESANCAKAVEEWAHMHSKPGLLKYVASLCSISATNWFFTTQSPRFTDSNKNCIKLQAQESELQSALKGPVPITRIFLMRPNEGHP